MGNNRYSGYAKTCRRNFSDSNFSQLALSSKPIFDDMYEQLKAENKAGITERMTDLLDTLKAAFRITKYFTLVFAAYLLANVVLLSLDLNYYVTCVSIVLMGICFLYKLIEFVSNKYCVMDAYLFMIYKSVLEKLAKELSCNAT
jgi:hypothetical protein